MSRPNHTWRKDWLKRFVHDWVRYASPSKPTPANCVYWTILGHSEIVLAGGILVESCLGIRPPQGSLLAQFALAVIGPVIGALALLKADWMARVLRWPRIALAVGGLLGVAVLATLLSLHPILPLRHPPG
jgi:hypothetical protein